MRSTEPKLVHVAVAIIEDAQARTLVARRQQGKHLAGLWEFPGGKVETGENVFHALQRECLEEIGITISTARPLIRITHHYSEKSVLLDTWRVMQFTGEARGCEGQEIAWHVNSMLDTLAMPAADKPILTALNLPDVYQITPDPSNSSEAVFLAELEKCCRSGCEMLQLRGHDLPPDQFTQLVPKVRDICAQYSTRFLLNTQLDDPLISLVDGLHLTRHQLQYCEQRPVDQEQLFAVSCHDLNELKRAEKVGADFAVLSPVEKTLSHPDVIPLGWPLFAEWVDQVNIPVYALGGMHAGLKNNAWFYGGQGIAILRSGWPSR